MSAKAHDVERLVHDPSRGKSHGPGSSSAEVTAIETQRVHAAPPTRTRMIQLQRSVGNRAVRQLIQRRNKRYFTSAVAFAPAEDIYSGKCDAELAAASVSKKWSRELLGKETFIIFECGPQSFRFRTFRPWFNHRGPWGLELADEGSAFVTDRVEQALDDIVDDIEDTGSTFWNGYHTIKSALKADLDQFCRD
jgi:hypothetical protein